MLSLEAIARGDWYNAVRRVRAAVDRCGAVLDERPFSGTFVSFRLELYGDDVAAFAVALAARDVVLDARSAAKLADAARTARSGDVVEVMLAVTFPDGDPNKRNVVPSVPG